MIVKILRSLALMGALLLFPIAALAGGDHDHGHGHSHESAAVEHSGQYVEIEGHHGVEMIAKGDKLSFLLFDNHKPMPPEGGSFKAVIQSTGGAAILPLSAKNGLLSVMLKKPLAAGDKVLFSGKDKHGHRLQARFVKK